MTAPCAGWYPDPAGQAPQRYWDGVQWSGAVAGYPPYPPAVGFPLAAQRRSFVERHPIWTAIAGLWIVLATPVTLQWLIPAAIVAVAMGFGFGAVRKAAREDARTVAVLAADAELQHRLHLRGDIRGIYGHYPPTDLP